ncbi:MAG: DUF3168 domain-containing protein [Alphaproteobacteria bacterium]|nr:DUF3168 domain-containing protein [Alphaproteobacteria bacterium]MDE2492907.1 DUF3168 domain-containing protein [Alphaproteobacteria bacterium]
MSASWALQQAAFAALAASDAVRAVAGDRVFDAVPRGAAFPYIVIGDDTEGNWDTATEAGGEHLLSVHVWSRGGGHRESKRAAAAVRETLDGAALTLDGHDLIDIRFLSADFRREADGETYRALLRFRAVTEAQS